MRKRRDEGHEFRNVAPPLLGQTSEKILTLQGTKALARRKEVSVRTIHRRLADAGLAASDIQDEKRKALLVELLRSELPLKTIAEKLHLSGPQSFNRMVRRLFRVTPGQLRHKVKGGDAPGDP